MVTNSFAKRSDEEAKDTWVSSSSQLCLNSKTLLYEQNPSFQLHVVPKKETRYDQPIIESTKIQRLSFYRAYTSSIYKTEVMCKHTSQFNWFLWFYTLNLIFKSLPHTFVHIFLASYSPEQHIFLPKMVPFCVGFKYLLIAASFFEVVTYIDTLLLMFQYFISGLFFKNPWNRCKNATYFDIDLNETVHCYEINDFIKYLANETLINRFSGYTYKSPNNESFQVAPVEYLRLNISPKWYWKEFAYFTLLWFIVSILTYYVSKKYFWKVLHFCQCSVVFIDICTFLCMLGKYIPDNKIKEIDYDFSEASSKLWLADIDMLAESTTAPPVAHILTARSAQLIEPSKDTTAIVLSNAALYLFRGLLTRKITTYCEKMLKAPIYFSDLNEHNFFYIRPIFYSSFYLGDLYILGFLGMNLFTEILTVTVIVRCLVEVIIYEWTKLKSWMINILIFVFATLICLFTVYKSRFILYIYAKGFATLVEAVFLYILYPLHRLFDDYKFHYGVSLPMLIKMSLQLVPFYYMMKFVIMIDVLLEFLSSHDSYKNIPHYKWSWCLALLPLLLGMVFTVHKYLFIYKRNWNLIFRPDPNWGPKESYLRQLRKLYDSRHYIKSAASRRLSRYFISKTEFKVYKIDVRYDFYRKYSTKPKEIRLKDDEKDT